MRMLLNSGITEVIAKNLYKDFDDITRMKDIKVDVSQDQDGFYHLTYKVGDNSV